jgi:hypothetical protein
VTERMGRCFVFAEVMGHLDVGISRFRH